MNRFHVALSVEAAVFFLLAALLAFRGHDRASVLVVTSALVLCGAVAAAAALSNGALILPLMKSLNVCDVVCTKK